MQWAHKQKQGFTIVELLIVIVVIAILAAITIVAYNGIQNRAKQSAVQSRLSQANKKILTFAVTHSDTYPADLAEAEIDNTDNGLQYSVNNTVSPKTYGLTASNGTISYYVSNTSSTPTTGGYPGHGQGGAVAVTNLVVNPSAETNATGFNANNAASTVARNTSLAYSGSSSMLIQSAATTSGYNGVNRSIPVVAGKTYTFSAWVYLNTSYGSGVAATTNGAGTTVKQGNLVTTIGSWIRTSVNFTPTTTGSASIYVITPSGSTVPVGNSFYTDAWMFTEGADVYQYADGASPNWIWGDGTGAAHASTSTGPALSS